MHPLIIMTIGIALVIGMIMKLKVNAFIALITAAVVVSLLAMDPVYDEAELVSALKSVKADRLEELLEIAKVKPANKNLSEPEKEWVRQIALGERQFSEQAGDVKLVVTVLKAEKKAKLTPAPSSSRLASTAITRVATAFGGACGGIGIVIALAAVIGTCMMDSGAADRVVRSFTNLLGEKRSPWALMGSGYILAVPVFFDTVFYLLVPLARSFYRRTGKGYLKCILAITAGGAITHTLVPPTPGPLAMASALGIDLGTMILVGAIVALPAAVAGIFTAGWMDRKYDIPMREIPGHVEPEPLKDEELPGLFESLLPVLLPVVMIACHTAADSANAKSLTAYTAVFGNPNFALLISTAIAIWVYVKQRGASKETMAKLVETSLMSGGVIILITAGGSAFGAMLKAANVGSSIETIARDSFGGELSGLVILFLAFGIASLLKIAQGSSTAAMIITAPMMADIVSGMTLPYHLVYLATAIGAGSLVGSWMNDSGFWIFTKMGGLTEEEGLKTWTPLLVILGLVSMAVTLVLSTVMPLAG
jgi:GntP family gluconate:H+ symporter